MEVRRKLWMKILSFTLAFILVFSSGIISCYAQGFGVFDSMETSEILSEYAEDIVNTDGVKSVDKEKSAANELYLNMKDGSTTVYAFSEPVLYTDENGQLRFKDNSIVKQKDREKAALGYDYSNTQNDYKIHISSDSSKGVLVETDGVSFAMTAIGSAHAEGYVCGSDRNGKEYKSFEYPGVFGKDTSLKYFLQLNGIKEEIILSQNTNQNAFNFLLTTKSCKPIINEDGSLSLLDQNDKEVQRFAAPFAYDADYTAGTNDAHYCSDCVYTIEDKGDNQYILTVSVSSEWLNAESTVYPVTIDPATVQNIGLDFTIDSSSTISSTEENMVGAIDEYEYYETLVATAMPSSITDTTEIHKAYYYANELTQACSDSEIGVHKFISGNVDLQKGTANILYDEQAKDVLNINYDKNNGSTKYKFDITDILQEPAADGSNISFVLKSESEPDPETLRVFSAFDETDSSMSPYIVINYTNDTSAPLFDNISKSPNTAWNGDNVVLTVNGARDSGSGLAEMAYSFSTNQKEYNWQASNEYIATSSGEVWIYIRDQAGNICFCGCESVKIDRNAPIIDAVAEIDSSEDSVLLLADATDSESGVSKYSFSYTAGEYHWVDDNLFEATKNGILYVNAKDETGNISPTFEYIISRFDETAPTVPQVTGNPDGWSQTDITITALSTDEQSGVAAYSFSTQKSVYEWQTENTKTFAESATVYVYAKDNKGNISEPNTVQIKIDKTAPAKASVSGNATNWTNSVVLTINDAVDDISGLDAAAYSFSTLETEYEWQAENSKIFTTNCTVYVHIRDAAGNITFVDQVVIDKIDRTMPEVSINRTDKDGYTTVTVSATDSESGVALYSFDDGATWQEENFVTFKDGVHNYLKIQVKDNAGNTLSKVFDLYLPQIYEENGYIGLYNPNPSVQEEIGFSLKSGLLFQNSYDYEEPFIVKNDPVEFYIYFKGGSVPGAVLNLKKEYPQRFQTITGSDSVGQYSESHTDAVFAYKNTNFDFTRYYTSQNGWFFSFESQLDFVDKGLIYGDMPDGTRRAFLYKSETEFYNESANLPLKLIYGENGAVSSYEVTYNGMIYGYDANGLLAYVADSSGNQIAISRTENQIVFTDDAGRNYTVLLDDNGNIVSLTDPAGGVIMYERDHSGNLIKVTDQAGVLLSEYQYNADGIMVKSSDKSITYDEAGRVASYTYDNGAYTKFTYSQSEYENLQSYQHKVIMKDSPYFFTNTINTETSAGASFRTEITEQYYDDSNVSQTRRCMYIYEGEEEQYHLITDIYGKPISIYTKNQDGSSESTGYEYDAGGKLIRTNNTAYFYDSNGNCSRTEEYDSENQMYYITYYVCDQNANVTKSAVLEISYEDYYNKSIPEFYDETLTYSEVMEYTYNSDGTLSKSEDVLNGNAVTYQYDPYGNVTKAASTSETDDGTTLAVTDYTYDILGNLLTAQSDSSTASYIYDAAGRQLRSDTDGSVSRTLYDNRGRVVQQIDPDVYDPAKDGLPAENTYSDPSAGHTYEYAENGNLVSETTKYGMETKYTYSKIGNLIQKHFDLYDYYYLENGKIDKICVDGETVVDYAYNVTDSGITLNDGDYVDQIAYSNGDTESYQYNGAGTLTAIYKNGEEKPQAYWVHNVNQLQKLPETYNGETKMHYLYDESNHTVSGYVLADDGNILQYIVNYLEPKDPVFDLTGQTAETAFSGTVFSTAFSLSSNENHIVNTAGEISSTYTYETDENGVLVSDGITFGENTVLPTSYIYDDSGRNTKKVIQTTNGAAEFSVQYDENGMLTGSGANEITAHYIYDESGQLIRTNDRYAEDTSVYEYDSRGNMISKKQYDYSTGDLNGLAPKETTTFTYANSGWKDQLVSVNGEELTYDENGNLRTYGDQTFSWSHGTRLESITDGENEYSYVYDENGIRFSKTVNGTTTQFVYLGGMLMAQKTGDDVLFFQYGAGGVPLGFVLNGVQYFYITNQLGDIIGITDSTGDAFVMYSYDEWGNPIQTITRDNTAEQNKIAEINPLRYRGYYYDAETGYYYLQSRYYNPEWGRFLSPDAFSYIDNSTRLGFNAYIYCTNNPVMYTDPTGTKKTNNVAEVIFKTLVISIELDALTNLFVNIVEIFNIDVNKIFNIDNDIDISVDFNAWFNSIADYTQKIFQETLLFFVTGINNFFKDIENLIAQSGLVTVIEAFIKDPFKVFEQYPNLSKLFSKLKLAPSIINCISSISSTIDDAIEGIIDTTQSVILIAYDVIITILDVFPQTKALSKVVNVTRAFTDIFFKYVNGEYI